MDIAKLTKNYIYNLIGQILILITPLITTPYISRVLGPANIGIYSYTLSISIYFIILGNLGYPLYGQREIAYLSGDHKQINEVFYEIFYGQLLTLGIAFLCYFVFVVFMTSDYQDIYMAQGIGVFASLINISWLYQGCEEFRIIVVRNLFVKAFFIAFLFLLVREQNDLLIYTLIINFANLFGNLLMFWNIQKYITVSPFHIHIASKNIWKHIKPAFILGIPFYITSIYGVLDKTMIGKLTGNYAEVGFFEQSQKIVLLAITIITSLGTVVMPRFSSEIGKNHLDEVAKLLNDCLIIVLFLAMPIMSGLIAISDNLVPWFFGPGYDKVSSLLILFSPLAVIMGLSNILGNQYMVAGRKERLLGWIMFFGLVLNFIFNLFLIPKFWSLGAAVSTVSAEIIKTILMVIALKKIIKMRRIGIAFLKYLFLSLIMGKVIFWIKSNFQFNASIHTTILLIGVGVCCYVVLLAIVKDKIFMKCTGEILKRFVK